jgi:hypothetical protein
MNSDSETAQLLSPDSQSEFMGAMSNAVESEEVIFVLFWEVILWNKIKELRVEK